MRRVLVWALVICCVAFGCELRAATGGIIKVLPNFLDSKGRNSVSPNLFERDSYQLYLRQNPKLRSGMRFDVQWKSKGGVFDSLKIQVELRGVVRGDLPKQVILEKKVETSKAFERWTQIPFVGSEYKSFGEVTAWRVTLWDGTQLLGEQRSYLW